MLKKLKEKYKKKNREEVGEYKLSHFFCPLQRSHG